uniref:Uncharacterized protein n=1 Tax=Avena sativa TaxID=4498 RepID=A0ACD5YKL2_AVESA
MGNCLVIQDRKEINVMSVVDGEILKALPAPPSKGDADADALPAGDMGQLYRLFPAAAVKAPSAAADDDQGAVVRVKLVISKQELRRMLGKDEQALSMDDMVTLMRRRSEEQQRQQQISCCRGWRPALHSIPEGSGDLFY